VQKYLHGIQVKFVYEGHQVKVKVTAAKKREIPNTRNACITSIGNNYGSAEDRAVSLRATCGFLLWRIECCDAIFVT